MMTYIRQAVVSTLALAIVLCAAYPVVVTAIGQTAMSEKANGSLVSHKGKVVGSALIGQTFTDEKYFHARPSAAGEQGYDAGGSSGSNYGPTSKALAERVQNATAALRQDAPTGTLPVELLTASGSGLDPHLTPQGALIQASRVAAMRSLPLETVQNLVRQYTEGPELGLFGEPRVNVLRLNMALDAVHN